MPTYEYRCDKCGNFEKVQKISDKPLTECPSCGGSVMRLLSAAAFHLKGSGWYKTDYGNGKTGCGAASSTSNGSSSGDTKVEKTVQSKEAVEGCPAAKEAGGCPKAAQGACNLANN